MIEVRGLRKSFGDAPVLRGIDLDVGERPEDRLQPEALVQLADQNQAGVRRHARSLKCEPVEHELKGRVFFLTHRVSPILAGFVARNPQESRRDDRSDE